MSVSELVSFSAENEKYSFGRSLTCIQGSFNAQNGRPCVRKNAQSVKTIIAVGNEPHPRFYLGM